MGARGRGWCSASHRRRGRDRELGEGDYLFLPAHCRHRVAWTRSEPPTVWLAIYMSTKC